MGDDPREIGPLLAQAAASTLRFFDMEGAAGIQRRFRSARFLAVIHRFGAPGSPEQVQSCRAHPARPNTTASYMHPPMVLGPVCAPSMTRWV